MSTYYNYLGSLYITDIIFLLYFTNEPFMPHTHMTQNSHTFLVFFNKDCIVKTLFLQARSMTANPAVPRLSKAGRKRMV